MKKKFLVLLSIGTLCICMYTQTNAQDQKTAVTAKETKIIDFNKTHPERQSGEVWLCNVPDSTDNRFMYVSSSNGSSAIQRLGDVYPEIRWKTKRLGSVAYDNKGNKLVGMFPVFVKKTELQKENPAYLKELEP